MKKAWIIQGGWDGHEPRLTSKRFGALLEKHDYQVEIFDSLDCLGDLNKLMEIDLLVACWTMGEIKREYSKNVSLAVGAGMGLAGCKVEVDPLVGPAAHPAQSQALRDHKVLVGIGNGFQHDETSPNRFSFNGPVSYAHF